MFACLCYRCVFVCFVLSFGFMFLIVFVVRRVCFFVLSTFVFFNVGFVFVFVVCAYALFVCFVCILFVVSFARVACFVFRVVVCCCSSSVCFVSVDSVVVVVFCFASLLFLFDAVLFVFDVCFVFVQAPWKSERPSTRAHERPSFCVVVFRLCLRVYVIAVFLCVSCCRLVLCF